MRIGLLALARLRARLGRESPAGLESGILDRYFQICARMLSSIGTSLLAGEPAGAAPECLQELQSLAEQLRELAGTESSRAQAMALDARFQMDALTGQLRSAVDLAAYATPAWPPSSGGKPENHGGSG